ncbi:MAG TPA: membrane protein insertase YidC [Leucothrix mucor]|nr:membrane protein insertase YidC [Leucothrix mucor]
MESQRNLLLLALLFVSFLLYQAWEIEQNPAPVAQKTEQTTNTVSSVPSTSNHSSDVPASTDVQTTDTDVPATAEVKGQTISIENDKLRLLISVIGGDVVEGALLEHTVALDSDEPFKVLNTDNGFSYIAQSGLIGKDGPDSNKKGRPYYKAANAETVITEGQDQVSTSLRYVDVKGNVFTKTFTLKRGEYVVAVTYHVENKTAEPLNIQLYGQIRETIQDTASVGMRGMHSYRGAAYSTDETRYKKYSYDDMKDANLNKATVGGWVGMLQHYFVSAWVPDATQNNVLYSNIVRGTEGAIGFKSSAQTVQANTTAELKSQLWVGPKLQNEMAAVGQHLDLTVDYGWLWFIAQPLFKLLVFFHGFVGNWGFAIILITFTVKGGMYPLTKAQYTSMAKMRLLQPKIQELRDRYGEDKQKVSKAMMELYKKEKVNPLGGCFPILLQMPIFIALYWSLMEAVELRHSPFILWIHDLSVQDPYYILPVLMGISMFFIQKMSPATVQDPMQQKIMKFMPVLFTFFFLWFPAGLVIYWLMSNIVTLIQQTIIFRQIEKQGLGAKNDNKKIENKS